MFNQNRKYIWLPYNRINSLPSVAGTILRAAFASLNVPAHKLARYAGC
jgi:protein involved in temperature-dependent protein secretion